ncbi:MAG: DUF4032 domain-containing protein [Verrucomicrobia bacterium]|nr:MAG: DUF4032 domain-containing protein [Verrucomicrobiota bacterium]
MQPDDVHSAQDDSLDAWVKQSRLFSHWQEIKEEILQHKWYESEKAGCDIGWERAAISWQIHCGHRADGDATG